jgi:hypothetical protein
MPVTDTFKHITGCITCAGFILAVFMSYLVPHLLLPLLLLLPQLMWSAFGVIWDLRMFGLVGLEAEEVVNLCCDFSAKVRQRCQGWLTA